MNIPIYTYEEQAGLREAIQSNASVAYTARARPLDVENDRLRFLKATVDHSNSPDLATATNRDQWDLFWLDSVLASVGWNENDDIFDPGETWAARHSAVHKKFNFMHDETDIIGHMTASVIVAPDGSLIDDSTPSIPEQYDVVVASVLYRRWADTDLQERMNQIIAAIPENKWFVSMECLFSNFDYAIITPKGENKIVPRTHASSFLTKHLRVYGGDGVYDDHRIGRLLRNFTFSGKGLVDNPANPRSIIFSDVKAFKSSQASIQVFSSNIGHDNMTHEIDLTNQLRQELNQAVAKNEKLESRLDELVADAQQKERDRLEKTIAGLQVDLQDKDKELDTANSTITDYETKVADLTKKNKTVADELVEANKQLNESKAVAVTANRVSALVQVGTASDEAEEVAQKWSSVSDEQFEDIIALHKERAEGKGNPFDKDKDKSKDDKDKSDASASDPTDDPNEDSAQADLDNADVDDDPNMGADSANAAEQMQAVAGAWLGKILGTDNKNEE